MRTLAYQVALVADRMTAFSRYVLRTFLAQLALLLVGFAALLQLFDLLSNSTEVMQRSNGHLSGLFIYTTLRMPEIISFLVPFCVLMGVLMTLGKLERDNEILAYKAAGAPYNAVLMAFLPAVGMVAIAHFLLVDQLVPYSINELLQKDLYIDKASKADDDSAVFIQDGMNIVEAAEVQKEGTLLKGVNLYTLGESGNLLSQRKIGGARYDMAKKEWVLSDIWLAEIVPDQGARITHRATEILQSQLTPTEFSDLIERPQAMTLYKIWSFVSSSKVGVRPTYFYETWLQKRISLPVSSILMILLAAPVAHSLHRRERGFALGVAIGFGLGFLYFITDGLVLSLGESGAIPPFFAAWLPIMLFASIGGAWLIRLEGY